MGLLVCASSRFWRQTHSLHLCNMTAGPDIPAGSAGYRCVGDLLCHASAHPADGCAGRCRVFFYCYAACCEVNLRPLFTFLKEPVLGLPAACTAACASRHPTGRARAAPPHFGHHQGPLCGPELGRRSTSGVRWLFIFAWVHPIVWHMLSRQPAGSLPNYHGRHACVFCVPCFTTWRWANFSTSRQRLAHLVCMPSWWMPRWACCMAPLLQPHWCGPLCSVQGMRRQSMLAAIRC